ncbi:MAG TPA: aminotransferase class III-fold pyridoxal phosphate-dependent enzyme [Gammaproteobacteria bacterium]
MNEFQQGAEAIAIVGMDGRFPGAPDVNTWWENLLAGRESIDRFAPDELDASIPAELKSNPDYVAARGQMPDHDRFDAAFFGISPAEAAVLDPQQRVFLEMCWRALEDAGYAPGTHDALTGVFGGMSNNSYFSAHVSRHPDVLARFGEIPAMVANEKDYLTTRVGYKLNLRGPCINVTTACSTALVAVCHAFNSLLDYQCDLALAGGVSILCPPKRGYLFQEGSIYSPDGHCRPFDASAGGTVFSNGGGVVVMKRLADAIRDRDTIHAVIRGGAMNNDGAGKVSFTAPSVDGQAEVIQMAQALAGVRPDEIGYVEAHGTGTALGDPIELAALKQAFGAGNGRHACGIGSVKGNIGHLDAAAGIAGLIKAVLAVREGRLPATLHFQEPNPALGLDDSPFQVIDTTRDWPANDAPRRAAVSAFGLGGTNAHVIVEQPPQRAATRTTRSRQLLVVSGKTRAALERNRAALAGWLERNPDAELADVAWTLQRGRAAFEHRYATAAGDVKDAITRLHAASGVTGVAGTDHGDGKAVFMFPGQGSQYVGMGRNIYRDEPLVRDIVDRCAQALQGTLAFDLRDVMFGRLDNADELLDETEYTQPALFVIEYALARLWMQRGVQPAALLGHSIGEFAAAALAEVFSLEDAVRVVAERARLMQQQPNGSMLAVHLPEGEVLARLGDGVTLAAANAPGLCVVSGRDANVQRMKTRLEGEGVGCRLLRTSHAFHSAMMDGVLEPFETFLGDIRMSPPKLPIVSTMTGERLSDDETTSPRYWTRQLREPVRFLRALETARREAKNEAWIEVGPGIATTTFARRAFAELDGAEDTEVVSSLGQKREPDNTAMLEAAGKLWTSGYRIDWGALHEGESRSRIPLPTYRFERTRYWLDSTGASQSADESKPAAAAPADAALPLAEQVALLLSEASGIPRERLTATTTFTELGLDSLLLTQFSQMLRKRFGVKVKFRELLTEHNHLKAVTALVERNAAAAKPAPEVSPPPARPTLVEAPRSALTETQQDWLDDLCRRYTWRTSRSKAFARTHRAHLADPRAVAGFDPLLKEMVYPIVSRSSYGARIQDLDGNRYVDLVNGFGSNLFGHSPPFVTEALRRQLSRGYETGPQTELAGRVARQVQAITGFPRISFCTAESEAVQAALRVARTVTGRSRIVMFSDDYHGVFDEVLARRGQDGHAVPAASGVPPELLRNVEVLAYGTQPALDRIAELGDSLAAVIVEPVQDRHPERYSPAFLRKLRKLTEQAGSALIFNELVSGFRVHPAGVQGLLDVRADMAVYGKICGGGLPLGILAGRERFMDALDGGDWHYGDGSAPEADVTFFADTHVRHPLALAAAEATLERVLEAGPGLQKQLDERTRQLVSTLRTHCRETGAPVGIRRFSSWFLIDVDPRVPYGQLLYYRLRAGGVHAWEDRVCYLSTAHTDTDIARIARVFRESLDEMRNAGFFAGIEQPAPARLERAGREAVQPPPQPGARLGRRPDGRPGWFIPDPDRPGRYRELRT